MLVSSRSNLVRALALGTAVSLVSAWAPRRAAAGGEEMCRIAGVTMTPSDDLQIVIWLETAGGEFVDTLYLTDLTGLRGLGNRPGRMDFNSSWRWPYGRRVTVFPVWSHRHGRSWSQVIFQNDDSAGRDEEDDLSHPPQQSSAETFYCKPYHEGEPEYDVESCASTVYTDKGMFAPDRVSLYPPRADLPFDPSRDHLDVQSFDDLNPFDAVSTATPIGGERFEVAWPIPVDLLSGDYVIFVEVSKEDDFNDTYNPTTYPEPTGITYQIYGEPFRGQPSVVYRVPFEVGPTLSVGDSVSYAGYGDPDGIDGDIRTPDSTIDTDTPGSGAQRLLTTIDASDQFQVRVEARLEFDSVAPGAADEGRVVESTSSTATVSFVEPGDDGLEGVVDGYEVRYRAGTPMDAGNFLDSSTVSAVIHPDEPGVVQLVSIEGLLPQTNYFVGVRAFDGCKNYGPLLVIPVTTAERETGEVDACFIATAAYGSKLANDVASLRSFRDDALRSNVLGELLVEAYYTFGPALAGVIDDSEDLRSLSRAALQPLVDWVRARWLGDAVE